MRKVILGLMITGAVLFATGQFSSNQFPDCSEMKLNESKSIISCINGDYEVTFKISGGKRSMSLEPIVKLIAKANQVTQYIQQK